MEPSVSEGNHGTARSKTSRTLPTVAGLSMNKHGLSMHTLRSHRPQQVYVALPPQPLNFNNSNISPPTRKHSLDSKTMGSHCSSSSPLAASPPQNIATTTTMDESLSSDTHDLVLPCRTIAFAASTLHDAMKRCLSHSSTFTTTDEHASLSFLVPLLQQLQNTYDSLEMAAASSNHDIRQQQQEQQQQQQQQQQFQSVLTTNTLMTNMNRSVTSLKAICTQLQSKLDELAQVLDVRMLRHLLLAIHGVTFDIKDAWQLVITATTMTSSSFSSGSHQRSFRHGDSGEPSLPSPQATRNRSHSENTVPSNGNKSNTTTAPAAAAATATPTSGLYAHLRMAVAASSHLVDVLNQSMDTMLQDMASQRRNHDGLETKLAVLRQPMQQAMVCSHQLNEHLDTIQEHGFTSHQTYTIQFWEDTNLFLKTFVSLMSLIRSLSTEEDINWTKSVKQCCLHVTRITAEIAKLWNNDPMFVQDGYYLGKTGGDDSTTTTSTSPPPLLATTTATAPTSPLSSAEPSSSNTTALSSSAPPSATSTTTNAFIPNSNVAATTTSSSSSFLDIPIPPK